jgi:hypothetical protein
MKTTLQELISEMEQLKETKLYNLASFKAIEHCLRLAYEKLETEKQQIIEASNNSYLNSDLIKRSIKNKNVFSVGEQYYNETFKQQ